MLPLQLLQSFSFHVLFFTVRLEESVDNYVEKTVKFAYVHWVGETVPFTKKGKFGVVHGSVQEHFQVRCVVLHCTVLYVYFFFMK